MVSYVKPNVIDTLPLGDLRFDGAIAQQVEAFFTERHRSDFAREVIYAETEEQFRLRLDDTLHVGYWRGEFWGKWVISSCRIARYCHDEKLKEFLHKAALNLIATADEDGYIGTYKNPENVLPCPPEIAMQEVGWASEWNWNVWCRKYTLWGLLECYELTGDEKILTAAIRFTDQLLSMLDRLGIRITDCGTFFGLAAGSIIKPLLILYRHTGDKKYLDASLSIAGDFEREDGRATAIIAKALAMKPVFDWYPMEKKWAKVYELLSCLDGLLELYRFTGTENYLKTAENMYTLLLDGEFNTLFSVGFNDLFLGGASKPNAISEPCDVIHWIRLCAELYCLTGNVKYINTIELAFYNPMLASFFRDGKWGARGVRTTGRHMVAHGQSFMEHSHCCVNNIPRGVLNVAEMFVLRQNDGVIINLYSDFTAKIGSATVTISGSYLTDGKVTVTIATPAPMTLKLRIPPWASFAKLDGAVITAAEGYHRVTVGAGVTTLNLAFGMTILLRELAEKPEYFPEDNVFNRRFTVKGSNYVDPSLMTWDARATLVYGPLLLTRSKLCGNTEAELYNSETVAHRGYTVSVEPIASENVRAAFKVTFQNSEKTVETVMCDYASGTNIESPEDMKLFNVFI